MSLIIFLTEWASELIKNMISGRSGNGSQQGAPILIGLNRAIHRQPQSGLWECLMVCLMVIKKRPPGAPRGIQNIWRFHVCQRDPLVACGGTEAHQEKTACDFGVILTVFVRMLNARAIELCVDQKSHVLIPMFCQSSFRLSIAPCPGPARSPGTASE